MKIVSLLLLVICIGTGCSSQKKTDMTGTQIEYTAMSRGLYKRIVVQDQKVSVTNGRDTEAIVSEIDNANWNKIVSEFEKINLDSLSALKAPTEKRFYDGATIGNLKIIQNPKT